jgi:hypothetical protein
MNASAAIADSLRRQACMQVRGMQASGLAAQALNVLFQVCFGPCRLHAQDTAASPTRRRPQTYRALFGTAWPSPRDSAISPRTVMNGAG